MEPQPAHDFRPPEAPVEMPYQVIERRQPEQAGVLAALMQLLARRASNE